MPTRIFAHFRVLQKNCPDCSKFHPQIDISVYIRICVHASEYDAPRSNRLIPQLIPWKELLRLFQVSSPKRHFIVFIHICIYLHASGYDTPRGNRFIPHKESTFSVLDTATKCVTNARVSCYPLQERALGSQFEAVTTANATDYYVETIVAVSQTEENATCSRVINRLLRGAPVLLVYRYLHIFMHIYIYLYYNTSFQLQSK